MVRTKPKFCLSTSRILVLNTAAFILLSACVSCNASEPRRCHWCGPLAEQVHRSRRASACVPPGYPVTACEPGLAYCATVATSPPYAESRYCVKFYQDECYPLFCNSTKTWKITCPCRGDLCNGQNTERENEAFEVLSRLVAKTHNARIKKRRAKTSPNLIQVDNTKIQMINNHSATLQSDVFSQEVSSSNSNEQDMQSDEPISIHIGNMTDDDNAITKDTDLPESPEETNKYITEIIIMENTATNYTYQQEVISEPKDINKIISENDQEISSEPSTLTTKIDNVIKTSIKDTNVKPSGTLPPPEALQDNASNAVTNEQVTEPTKPDTTVTSTKEILNTTPESNMRGRNNAVKTFRHIFVYVNCIILYCYM